MNRMQRTMAGIASVAFLLLGLQAALPSSARAQDEAAVPDTTKTADTPAYQNTFAGEFTPARGYDIIKTSRGSLNISVYGLFRWVDQMPGDQTYKDHLDSTRTVKARNDLNWHRSMVWVSGFFYDPRFMYTMTIWSLATTQQTLVFGNLRYKFSNALTMGAAIAPNLTSRSTQGSWPFWAATDRQMGEEFFRGGFSSGFYVTGMPISRFYYTGSVNTNLSQLGVTASNDTRDLALSGSLFWMPTTGEFGPRGGVADFENHRTLATKFGISACKSRESRYAPNSQPPNATQIRLSDGVYPFETGALARGVTVESLDYNYVSMDVGLKYHGLSFQGEAYYRMLSDFKATGPTPEGSIKDTGIMVEVMHMVVPKTLGLYLAGGYVNDQFRRYPGEISYGADFFPFKSRSWRLNLHVIHIDKSPTGSNFGFYTAGQTGTTVSLGTDFLL